MSGEKDRYSGYGSPEVEAGALARGEPEYTTELDVFGDESNAQVQRSDHAPRGEESIGGFLTGTRRFNIEPCHAASCRRADDRRDRQQRHALLPSSLAVVGIVPGVIIILFLGIFATFTSWVLIEFKLRHPQGESPRVLCSLLSESSSPLTRSCLRYR